MIFVFSLMLTAFVGLLRRLAGGKALAEGPGLEAGAGADGRHRQVIITRPKKKPRRSGAS